MESSYVESGENGPRTRGRQKNVPNNEYEVIQEFSDWPAFEEWFNAQKENWKLAKTAPGVRATVLTYLCAYSRRKKYFNCKMILRVVFDGSSVKVELSKNQHNHEMIGTPKFIDEPMKKRIRELRVLGKTATQIYKQMERDGFARLPSKAQIANLITRDRRISSQCSGHMLTTEEFSQVSSNSSQYDNEVKTETAEDLLHSEPGEDYEANGISMDLLNSILDNAISSNNTQNDVEVKEEAQNGSKHSGILRNIREDNGVAQHPTSSQIGNKEGSHESLKIPAKITENPHSPRINNNPENGVEIQSRCNPQQFTHNELFCLHVARTLDALPANQQTTARFRISQILFEMESQQYSKELDSGKLSVRLARVRSEECLLGNRSEPDQRPSAAGPIPADEENTRWFVALYDYNHQMSANPNAEQEELSFRKHQLIKVFGEKDQDGFYYAEIGRKFGLVPSNMVFEIAKEDVCQNDA